jgi:hypothetical protein
MNEIDRDYYAARAQTEWRLSETAADPFAAQVHAALAERYDALVAKFDEPARPKLRIAS